MPRRLSLFALTVTACLGLMPAKTSAQLVYGISGQNDVLLRIDRSNGSAVVVGPLGFNAVGVGMDFDNNGVLWALLDESGTAVSNLYTIDTGTGAATFVVTLDQSIAGRGIAFAPDGVTLYSTSANELYRIDIGTGATTLVGNLGFNTNNLASSQSGVFYCTENGTNQLHELDETTAIATPLGVMMGSSASLTFDDAANRLLSGNNQLYEIDPSNGASVLLGNFGIAQNVVGMAYFDLATPVSGTTWGRVKKLYR